MPWSDWQFWVVSLVVLVAVWRLVLLFVPRSKPPRTTLTISARTRDEQA